MDPLLERLFGIVLDANLDDPAVYVEHLFRPTPLLLLLQPLLFTLCACACVCVCFSSFFFFFFWLGCWIVGSRSSHGCCSSYALLVCL